MAVAHPMAGAGEIEVRKILRDGNVVAILMGIDQGDTFTVVAEIFRNENGAAETTHRRPYTFANADEGLAFLSEAVTSFTYLGCEVRHQ